MTARSCAPEPPIDMVAVGQAVKDRRIGLGLTRPQLAAAAGVTGQTLYNIEAARHAPSLMTLGHIAHALGVSVRDLLPEDL